MKKFLFFIGVVISFYSCSFHEELDLSTQGNGFYKIDVDMSQMIDFLKNMDEGKPVDSADMAEKDTLISLRPLLDSVGGDFTPEEKAYFYNGTLQMKANFSENKMNMIMTFPIKDLADFKKFLVVFDKYDSLNTLKKLAKQKEEENLGEEEMENPFESGAGLANNLSYKPSPYIITDTSIERLSMSKEEMKESMGEEMDGMENFYDEMKMKVSIRLPRPAKKLVGKNASLSSDKKVVTLSASFSEMMENVEANSFKVIF